MITKLQLGEMAMRYIGFVAALFLGGCATIVNDSHIPLSVSFSDGSSGSCNFKNRRGAWSARIPASSIMVRRSDDVLHYECSADDNRTATGSIRSGVEGGKLAASIIFWDFGITDAITDKHRYYQGRVVIPIDPAASTTGVSTSTNALPRAAPLDSGSASNGYAPKAKRLPENEYKVGQLARSLGCEAPQLLSSTESTETFQAACSGGQDRIIQCEFTNCRVLQ